MTTASRYIYLQGKEYFSITSKLGQLKPDYHPTGTRIHSAGVKISAAPSTNEVKTTCSDISNPIITVL